MLGVVELWAIAHKPGSHLKRGGVCIFSNISNTYNNNDILILICQIYEISKYIFIRKKIMKNDFNDLENALNLASAVLVHM